MNERLDYIIDVVVHKEDGFNDEGYWYVNGIFNDGTIKGNVLLPLKNFTFIDNGPTRCLTISEAKSKGIDLEEIADQLIRVMNSFRMMVRPINLPVKSS